MFLKRGGGTDASILFFLPLTLIWSGKGRVDHRALILEGGGGFGMHYTLYARFKLRNIIESLKKEKNKS